MPPISSTKPLLEAARSLSNRSIGSRTQRSVSFGSSEVIFFKSDHDVKSLHSGKNSGELAMEGVPRSASAIFASPDLTSRPNFDNVAVEAAALSRFVGEIVHYKWVNPIIFLCHGETMDIEERPSGNRLRMGCVEFIRRISDSDCRGELTDVVIHKRGFTVTEILKRASRTLNHCSYMNSLVQLIYCNLTPRLRAKTDAEWNERRTVLRAGKLGTSNLKEKWSDRKSRAIMNGRLRALRALR